MNIRIIAVGKEKDFAAQGQVAEYSERISHYFPIEWTYIPASDPDDEGERILKAVDAEGAGAHLVALDEKGKEHDSKGFAGLIQTCMNESARSIIFVIGGAHGLPDAVRARTAQNGRTIALSKLTFPHQLVRLVLAEQIYRACTIICGEKYHH
jgi:23S rRNA (pseudouridine1915-N3)-methyltransferase